MIYEDKLNELYAAIGEESAQAEATRETIKKLQCNINKIKDLGPDSTPGTYDSADRAYDTAVLRITKLIGVLNNTANEYNITPFFDGDITDTAAVILHAMGL